MNVSEVGRFARGLPRRIVIPAVGSHTRSGVLGIAAVVILGVCAPALSDTSNTILFSSGGTIAGGERIDSFLESSVNRFGTVAFLGSVTTSIGSGTSILLTRPDLNPERITFAPSATRLYSSIQLSDAGDVVARDRVSGAPATFFLRLWRSGGSFNVLASSNDGVFDSVLLPSLANDGAASFVGLTNGSSDSDIYVNRFSVRGDNETVAAFTAPGSRPVIANGSRVVVRGGNPGSQFIQYSEPSSGIFGGFVNKNITGPGFSAIGSTPGVSDAGRLTAFYGADSSGPGIFVADLSAIIIEPKRVISLGNALNAKASSRGSDISISALTVDSKVAVERLASSLGKQYRLLFSGTDSAGNASLMAARIDLDNHRVFDITTIASTGATIGLAGNTQSRLVSTVSAQDALSTAGHVVFQATYDNSSQALVQMKLPNFTKYKQGDWDGNVFDRWSNQRIHPTSTTAAKFELRGCFITSFAMVSSIYGKNFDPLDIRGLLAAQGFLNSVGGVNFDGMKIGGLRLDGDRGMRVTGRGGSLSDAAARIRAGNPVMLGVPSSKYISNGADTELHAIVAYGVNPNLAPSATATAADIYVADPAGVSFYKTRYPHSYTPGEVLVDVTLQDVFDRASKDGPYKFDAVDWFDNGRFQSDTGELSLLPDVHVGRDMTFFELATVPTKSFVTVESPVQVVLVDATNKRYVSDAALARPGDIVLDRMFFEIPGAMSDEIVSVPDMAVDPFPTYALLLPTELVGANLEVQVIGIGDGPFKVSLHTGSDVLESSVPLSGAITLGQVIDGDFTVTAVPEPETYVMLGVGLVIIGWRVRAAAQDRCRR